MGWKKTCDMLLPSVWSVLKSERRVKKKIQLSNFCHSSKTRWEREGKAVYIFKYF